MRSDRILRIISESRGRLSDSEWQELLLHVHESLTEAFRYGLTRLGRVLTAAYRGSRGGEVRALLHENELASVKVTGDPALGMDTQGLFFLSGRYSYEPDDPGVLEELARASRDYAEPTILEELVRPWHSEQVPTGRIGTTYVWGLTHSYRGGGWVVATIKAEEMMMLDHQPDGTVDWSTFDAVTSIDLSVSTPEEIRKLTGLGYPDMFHALVQSIRSTKALLQTRLGAVSSVLEEWELAEKLYEVLRTS